MAASGFSARKGARRALIAGVLVVLAAGGVGLWYSPWLKFQTVQVVGNQHQATADVVAAAALVRGTRLSAISSSQIAARVGALPWVGSVTVTHVLPSRVRIRVHERVPAVVVLGQGHSYLVDPQGAVLQEGSTGYPQLTGLPVDTLVPGQHITLPAFAAAIAVLDALPQALRGRLATINAPDQDLVSVTLTDHTLITYGDSSQLSDKNYAVNALLSTGSSFVSIDVRAPAHPAAVHR